MEFYTNISRYGNKLLYRGYTESGKKVKKTFKFKPTLFVSSNKGQWKSVDGVQCAPIEFESMRDAKNWIDENSCSYPHPRISGTHLNEFWVC